MEITDCIYDDDVIEGILEELIISDPVQRLKGVYQGGASYFVNEKWDVTRYEHSVGVMLLIRRLNGSLEEQIAGLLHDVSHTAFSHVIDYAFENKKEDYHEEIYHQVIVDSEIPRILSKYGFDYKDILLDHSKWSLLEQAAPELCVDRIDYTLRDMYRYGNITKGEIDIFLNNLSIREGKIFPRNIEIAEWFVKTYYKEVIEFFMNPLNVYGSDLLAKTLKIALDKNIIDVNILLGTDEKVLNILRLSNDIMINDLLNQLHRNVRVKEDKSNYDLHFKSKMRLIDPSIFYKGKLIPSSVLSTEIKKMNENAKRKAEEGMYIKIVAN